VPTFSVTLEAPLVRAEDIASDLFDLGAAGVEVRDGEAAPMPGARLPSAGNALLVAWFPERAAADEGARLHGGVVAEVPDEDWGEGWKKDFRPLDVGRVRVRPSWIHEPPPPGAVEVVIDPGMAGATVLDVGTGSGLLAIAARKLGAARVAANDVDPKAVEVARENAAANGVELEIVEAPLPGIPGTFDVVVANILANTLVELAPELAAKLAPGGVLLLSGLLHPQEDEVRRAYVALGLAPLPGRREGEWSLVALERRA
jgi:ribosomal protein L11 methyltransferase